MLEAITHAIIGDGMPPAAPSRGLGIVVNGM